MRQAGPVNLPGIDNQVEPPPAEGALALFFPVITGKVEGEIL